HGRTPPRRWWPRARPASRTRPSVRTGRWPAPSSRRPTGRRSPCAARSPLEVHRAAVPLVEVLHAVFHRALVGADLVVAPHHQRLAAGVHALADLVVFEAGLHVGGLLG